MTTMKAPIQRINDSDWVIVKGYFRGKANSGRDYVTVTMHVDDISNLTTFEDGSELSRLYYSIAGSMNYVNIEGVCSEVMQCFLDVIGEG